MGMLLKPKPLAKKRTTTQEYFAMGETELCQTLLIYGELITLRIRRRGTTTCCTILVTCLGVGFAI